tara:strand:- start:20 stop:238 length:219 start_codon:yes stop_codon:yes gene_type:complete
MPEHDKKPIVELNKKVHSLHQRFDKIEKDIEFIKKTILELNYKVPERKRGYLWDGWDVPKEKPMVADWDKLQ